MLSDDFSKSCGCNHEAAIAYSRYKCDNVSLIPISIDGTIPYGIFSGVQRKNYDEFNSLDEFAEIINDKTFSFKKAIEIFKKNKINNAIEELRESKSGDVTKEILDRLDTMNLSSKNINILLEVAMANDQVSHCLDAPNFFSKYFHKYGSELNGVKVKNFKRIWSSVFGKDY